MYCFIIFLCGNAICQTPQQDFDAWKRKAKADFAGFKQQQRNEYDEFRRKANAEYAEFMKQAWRRVGGHPVP